MNECLERERKRGELAVRKYQEVNEKIEKLKNEKFQAEKREQKLKEEIDSLKRNGNKTFIYSS